MNLLFLALARSGHSFSSLGTCSYLVCITKLATIGPPVKHNPNGILLVGSGDKNISILHLSCRMSDLQFSLVLQTHALVLLKAYAIKNTILPTGQVVILPTGQVLWEELLAHRTSALGRITPF